MSKRPLQAIINDLKALISELEGADSVKIGQPKAKLTTQATSADYSGPSGGIKQLLDDGKFSEPLPLSDVVSELKKRGYHYKIPAIATALLRAVRNRLLTRVEIQTEGSERKTWGYAERK